MASLQICIIALSLSALVDVAASSGDKGDKNVKTLKKLFKVAEMIQGKAVNKELMDKLVSEMGSMYAAKVDCEASKESPIGFQLKGASLAECGAAFTRMSGGMKSLDWSAEFAEIAGSKGRAILVWNPGHVELPLGSKMEQATAWKFEFNEEGKISKYAQEFDTTALQESDAKKNVETVVKMFDNAKLLLKGKQYSSELIKKVTSELASSFTPTINCAMSPASNVGFDLKSVSLQECGKKFQEALGLFKQVDWNIDAVAADPASGGRTVLLWQKNFYEIAERPFTMNHAWKLELNTAGLISAYTQELDTSVILDAQAEAKAASLAAQQISGSAYEVPGIFLLGCCMGAAPLLAILIARRYQISFREGYDRLVA